MSYTLRSHPWECGTAAHCNRRTMLRSSLAIGTVPWMTILAERLALADKRGTGNARPQSLIMIWLAGGPSQLETFDPHAGKMIAGGTTAISTSLKGVQLASGLPRTAEMLSEMALIRNVVSKEGDHERGAYTVKTGYRPDPTLVHPSIGAIICHHLPIGPTEIPRHVSILPNSAYGRGGYLGAQYDAYQVDDVRQPLPDLRASVESDRFQQRLKDLDIVEQSFRRGRIVELEERKTLHRSTIERATTIMDSSQLEAFDVKLEPQSVRDAFGDNPFGRGCLAAVRLTEVGVRCIEVTLSGWDSHLNNHDIHARLNEQLDPALAATVRYLRERDLLDNTVVLCGGEFGRTPQVNDFGGRDHWPHGFSLALAGGGLRKGVVLGETDPEGGKVEYEAGTPIENIHATLLHQLGIDPAEELQTPVGRPMKLSQGSVISALV